MKALNETDKFIRNFVKDSPSFVECWEFEDEAGEVYRICQDQNGGEWIEEGE